MPTPHNAAQRGDFAPTVLMPGDPLRAKFIAESFLDDPRLVTGVRNVLGYTGSYHGRPVSVMASGMGMPSIGIYSHELYTQYDVKRIIRVGSAGSLSPDLHVGDLLLVTSAYSRSTYALVCSGDAADVQYPSEALVARLRAAGQVLDLPVTEGCIHSSDVFYGDAPDPGVAAHRCLGVEMESFALFHNARRLGREAACLLTVSDEILTGREMTAKERETTFGDMIRLALEGGLTS